MAKKEKQKTSKRWTLLILPLLLASAGWWAWQSPRIANWKDQLFQYVDNRDILTWEVRFSPEHILEAHGEELLEKDNRVLQNTVVKYYPYLLLDVKYQENSKSREGVLLWGLSDGEMVLDTHTWETTHGFRDCLECQATRNEFKVLQTLAKHSGGPLAIEQLHKDLNGEHEIVKGWIDSAKEKYLVVQKGNLLQLHFENPKLLVTPQTKVKQHLVSKPLGEGQKVAKTYGYSQITTMAKAAFGPEFHIRKEQEVFLPVYSLEILNGDGSIHTSEWNALTGHLILPRYLSSTPLKNESQKNEKTSMVKP